MQGTKWRADNLGRIGTVLLDDAKAGHTAPTPTPQP